jgi:hypothetical protein
MYFNHPKPTAEDVIPDSGTSTMSSQGSRDSTTGETYQEIYGNFRRGPTSFSRTDYMDGRNIKVRIMTSI